jgi:hypothetical protein
VDVMEVYRASTLKEALSFLFRVLPVISELYPRPSHCNISLGIIKVGIASELRARFEIKVGKLPINSIKMSKREESLGLNLQSDHLHDSFRFLAQCRWI